MAKKARPRATPVGDHLTIDFVILADAAQQVGGKLYLMGGGWNIYGSPEFPSVLPFGVGVGILVPWAEANRHHKIEVRIAASEGVELLKLEGEFEVGREAGLRAGMTQRFMLAFSGQMQLPDPGTYELTVSIPGASKRVTFDAIQVAGPPRGVAS